MSGRRREGLAPTMFPFLAVLICTLGTLILMLALIANNGSQAEAAVEAAPSANELADNQQAEQARRAQAMTDLDREIREAEWYRSQVVQMRDSQTADLEERRNRQAHLEDHLMRLTQELQQLEREVKAAHDEPTDKASEQAAIERLKAKVAEEKAKIDALEQEQQSRLPRVVIVPHKGPNGTDRRPVYIECRANGVYLHPEEIAIATKYLDNGLPTTNPLDAALRAIRHHAMQNYGDTVAPYPLLVVRPDGIETYAAARYAMRTWDDQFGYELVPSDVKLAFPNPDPVLKQRVEEVVAIAVRDQESIARNGSGFNRLSPAGTTARSSAGTDAVAGANLAAPNASGTSRQPTGSTASGGTSEAGSGSASTENSLSGSRSADPRRASDFPVLSARNMEAHAIDALENGYRSSRSRTRSSLAGQRPAREPVTTLDDGDALPGNLQAELQNASATLRSAGGTSGSSTGSKTGSTSDTAQGTAAGMPAAMTANATNAAGTATAEQGTAPKFTATSTVDTAGASKADAFAASSSTTGRTQAPSATTDPNAPIGGNLASGAVNSTQPMSSEALPPDQAMPRKQVGEMPPGATPSDAPPQLNAAMAMQNQQPPRALVKRKGANWALPPDVANSTGTKMVRTIRVECYEDRFVLLPEGGRGATVVYGFSDGDINRASLELATSIRDRVDRWGAAMPGARWQPLLDVKVAAGGHVRYQQLRRLLDGSGVEIQSQEASR